MSSRHFDAFSLWLALGICRMHRHGQAILRARMHVLWPVHACACDQCQGQTKARKHRNAFKLKTLTKAIIFTFSTCNEYILDLKNDLDSLHHED